MRGRPPARRPVGAAEYLPGRGKRNDNENQEGEEPNMRRLADSSNRWRLLVALLALLLAMGLSVQGALAGRLTDTTAGLPKAAPPAPASSSGASASASASTSTSAASSAPARPQ